jgi:transposase
MIWAIGSALRNSRRPRRILHEPTICTSQPARACRFCGQGRGGTREGERNANGKAIACSSVSGRSLGAKQTADGRPLPEHLKRQIYRELERLELLLAQIKAVESERDELLARKETSLPAPTAMLLNVKGIGPEFASMLWSEGLFRHFDNRRQVAAYAGLAATPWKSGSIDREQGVSKSGNPRLRTTMIQLAWLWLRHQPQSALTLWFKERIERNGGRLRKTAIVALARKLLVALWKYVTSGVVIEGVVMKTAEAC